MTSEGCVAQKFRDKRAHNRPSGALPTKIVSVVQRDLPAGGTRRERSGAA